MFLEVEGGSKHQFVYNPVADTYFSDIVFPSAGPHQSYVAIDYGNNQVDSVEFNLVGITLGEIKDKDGLHLDGVQVVLLDENKQQVNTGLWGQVNPMVTNQNGFYGWVVPNGLYFIYAKKDGYFERRIPFVVTNNVVNKSFELLPKIAPLKIDLKGPVVQNIQNIAKSLGEQAAVIGQETVDVISDLSNDPEVKKQAGQVVAPTAVGVVAIGTISLVSWTELLSLLRFLFLQPLLLLGWKKREKWGLVYNSLNKLPIDLAVVRLLETKTGRIVQSKVTDAKGRYVLSAKPGAYRIVVNKGGFVFPSAILKDFKDDGRNVDIYHGESVEVTENDSTISPNIPLDMVGVPTVPKRLVWQKVIRRVQTFISWLGLIVTAVSLYLSPKWYVLVLLILHLFLFFVFRRLATPVKPKGWGIAYDTYSRKPIARVIARLFDNQFNKLVATQITDSKGRYYFLAGENKYYVTYSHENYEEYKTAEISTIGKDGLVAPTVALKKIEEK
jgi:hypothetical protein